MTEPLQFKGLPGSPYTRKMLAVLRYRRIAYAMLFPGSPELAAMPQPRVELLPTFYLKNASGGMDAVTDSTPLIRRFEAAFTGRQIRPADPVIGFLDSLLEDYADEWLTKAMFHYRWSFSPDIAKSGNILPRWRKLDATDSEAADARARFSRRQIDRLHFVGSSPETAPLIEASFVRFLDAFEAHLKARPFLLGARPGAADFAVYGQLTQLAHFDPTPAAIALERAPRVYAWVGLVDDLTGMAPAEGDWLARDALPATLQDLLAEVGRVYVPVLLANARALLAGAEQVHAKIDGQAWVQNPFPYHGKCLKWLREEFVALGAADQAATMKILGETGCSPLIEAPLQTA